MTPASDTLLQIISILCGQEVINLIMAMLHHTVAEEFSDLFESFLSLPPCFIDGTIV
jgi:hypothetical protein